MVKTRPYKSKHHAMKAVVVLGAEPHTILLRYYMEKYFLQVHLLVDINPTNLFKPNGIICLTKTIYSSTESLCVSDDYRYECPLFPDTPVFAMGMGCGPSEVQSASIYLR
jgi:hypothetical protein